MITCESFRERFRPATEDAELLEHLRSCDRCLDLAAGVDPDVMFRAIGGEIVPPGGLDAFVDGVMQQVRVRSAETTVSSDRGNSWSRRLALAATLAAGVSGAMLFNRAMPVTAPTASGVVRAKVVRAPDLATRPVVESYESSNAENATIVEMPSESAGDVKIVMIFDENLPADL